MKGLLRLAALLLLLSGLNFHRISAQEAPGQLPLLTPEEQKDPEMVKAVLVTLVGKKRPDLALPYMEAFLAMGKKNGATPGELMWIYLNMADGQRLLGREEEALTSILGAVALGRTFGDLNTREYQDFLFAVGNNLFETGHPAEAEPLFLELLRADTLYDRKERELAICVNLYTWYGNNGWYQKLRPVLETMIPWLAPVSTPEQQAGHYHTLGILYNLEGAYDKAEKNLLKASGLYREVPGQEKPADRVTLDLAMIYMKMGDPDRALRIAEEVRRSPSWSGDSLTERLLLSITAVHAIHQGNYLQAKSQYTRLLETAPRGGIHELDYATDLGTMGTIHWHLREYDRAGEMYRRAIGIYRETRDTTWGQFANLKGNLGLVYLRTGSFREAAAWAASAVASYAALHREDHPDCLTHRINRTFGLEGAGEITEAIGESLVNNEALRNLVEKNLLYWSENEMEAFLSGYASRFFDYHHALWFRNREQEPSLAGRMYDNQLFLKGILLQSALRLQQAVAAGTDTTLTRLAVEEKGVRTVLEELLAQPPTQRKQDPALLQNREDRLRKQIKERVNQLREGGNPSFGMLTTAETGFREIREALGKGEAAIEFVSFKNSDPWHESDTTWYCALLLRKEDPWPLVRFLTTGDRLEHLLALHPDELYFAENSELATLVWKPLEKELQGITTLYYSPSGLLHRVSFAALPTGPGKVLSDQYKLVNLSSTRNLIRRKKPGEATSGMVLGGINYNSSSGGNTDSGRNAGEDLPPSAPGINSSSGEAGIPFQTGPGTKSNASAGEKGYEADLRSLRGSAWDFLPGTQEEATRVSRLLGNHQLPVTLLMGSDATEERFKALGGASPALIHLASHGFSLPPPDRESSSGEHIRPTAQEVIATAGIPLMRSGLLLAGANQAWVGGSRSPGREDGILTAWEISHLDLSATELAVLSACQTGLGEIRGNEGVYGLQRALFMAGAQSMVVSLWEVPDLETMELMDHFYTHLVRGSNPETAFLNAQNELKELYRDQPSLWAGFVFIR